MKTPTLAIPTAMKTTPTLTIPTAAALTTPTVMSGIGKQFWKQLQQWMPMIHPVDHMNHCYSTTYGLIQNPLTTMSFGNRFVI